MEPLKPTHRDALKQEHNTLTDEIINQYEDLLAQRFLIDPEADPLRIQQLDQERAELIEQEMPRFDQVIQKICGEEQLKREGN